MLQSSYGFRLTECSREVPLNLSLAERRACKRYRRDAESSEPRRTTGLRQTVSLERFPSKGVSPSFCLCRHIHEHEEHGCYAVVGAPVFAREDACRDPVW